MTEPLGDEIEQRVLALTPTAKDAEATRAILESNGVRVLVCEGLEQLCQEAGRGVGALLITEESLASKKAGGVRRLLDDQPPWSDLPLIVLMPSGPEDPRATRAFESFDNVTLVKRPVELSLFVSTVKAALRDRRRQYEVRAHLAAQDRQAQELKRSEESLREADRRKDEFLAMLAHELRNPLAAVGNAVNVLRLSANTDDVVFARAIIERQTEQLGQLIDDLLDVSRITTGKIRLRKELVDAGSILARAIELARPLIDERRHRLLTDFEPRGLPLLADPMRIEQIVLNLLTNAAKYTEIDGTIWLSGRVEGDQVVISVRDTGMGIAPEKLPEMFRLFSQGERSIARSEGGLGIGLTIVKKLAEIHGGGVTATSDGPGLGSEFVVRLPSAQKALPPKAHHSAAMPARKGARILVVDDNEDTARSMVRFLKLLGNEVRLCYDGPAGLETARVFRPEYVLLDIGLPGMDGYEVASRLKEEAFGRDAVIIGVSGYGQDEDRRRSSAAGFDHHLVKPVDIDSLVTLLGRVP